MYDNIIATNLKRIRMTKKKKIQNSKVHRLMTTNACENDLVSVLTQGCQTPGPCFTFEKQTTTK